MSYRARLAGSKSKCYHLPAKMMMMIMMMVMMILVRTTSWIQGVPKNV